MQAFAVFSALLALLILSPSTALAESVRFAIVIGANVGEPDEEVLRYAERDARRVADVFGQVGQVPVENLTLLLGQDAASVERVISEVNLRIAQHQQRSPDVEALLTVFYSGHADAAGLHLAGTQFPFAKLKRLLAASQANLKVLIVDACRSGMVTRVKGGSASSDSFDVVVSQALAGEGMAIITSSSADEDAQESERLRGSFFTHHFVSGLLGAADKSRDQRVSLAEAYNYAYDETIRSTSRARFVQHPTYAFQIKGRQDLILTDLNQKSIKMGSLSLADGGAYMLFRDSDRGPVVAEFKVEPETRVRMQAGRYHVMRRTKGAVFEGDFTVQGGATTAVSRDQMRRVPYAQLARKGAVEKPPSAWSLNVAAGVTGPIAPDTGAVAIGELGVQVDLDLLTLQLNGRFGRSDVANDFVTINQSLFGGSLSLLKLFDWESLSFGFGARAGADFVEQSFSTPGIAEPRASLVWGGGLVLHAAVNLFPWMSLFLQGDAAIRAVPLLKGGASSLSAEFVPNASLGLNLHLF